MYLEKLKLFEILHFFFLVYKLNMNSKYNKNNTVIWTSELWGSYDFCSYKSHRLSVKPIARNR